MDYVVWMDGEKVRSFSGRPLDYVQKWAKLYCKGSNVRITTMSSCPLPRASRIVKPNLDMPDLRYKPFVSMG